MKHLILYMLTLCALSTTLTCMQRSSAGKLRSEYKDLEGQRLQSTPQPEFTRLRTRKRPQPPLECLQPTAQLNEEKTTDCCSVCVGGTILLAAGPVYCLAKLMSCIYACGNYLNCCEHVESGLESVADEIEKGCREFCCKNKKQSDEYA